jgi:hypothetical protein
VLAAALLTASFANISVVIAQNPAAPGVPDSSQNTLCWDVLNNVAREKSTSAGRVQATGDNAKMHSGSSDDRKVQGPGAEPKDSTGVTVGEGNAGQKKIESGSSIRPSGLSNC